MLKLSIFLLLSGIISVVMILSITIVVYSFIGTVFDHVAIHGFLGFKYENFSMEVVLFVDILYQFWDFFIGFELFDEMLVFVVLVSY